MSNHVFLSEGSILYPKYGNSVLLINRLILLISVWLLDRGRVLESKYSSLEDFASVPTHIATLWDNIVGMKPGKEGN